MEVAYACVFDPSTAPGGYSFDAVRAHVARRLPAEFRRRCVPVPLGLDHPRWVDDPRFELDDHLRRARLPRPGDVSDLAVLVADVMARKLDPDLPPWEMTVVEDLDDRKVGVIAKVHHSMIDGVSGSAILAKLLDAAPDGGADPDADVFEQPEAGAPDNPSAATMLRAAFPDVLAQPMRTIRAARELGRTTVRLARHVVTGGTAALSLPLGAPPQFTRPLRAGRSVSFARLNMHDIGVLREYSGVSVNDVVLAACAGALRSYLLAQGAQDHSPLIAVVPVSVRDPALHGDTGNRLSAMFVPLANDLTDPLDRLRSIAHACSTAKAQERSVGFGPLASAVADAVPPAIARPALRLGHQLGAVRHIRPGNLVVSNVPGAAFPLFFAGMRMLSVYPIGPVVDGVVLNITVQGYMDSLYVGLNACAAAIPDTERLARAVEDELSVLAKEAGEAGLSCAANLVAREDVRRPVRPLRPGSTGASEAPGAPGSAPPLVVGRSITFGVPSLR
ncbi:MAG TPA: wax ester/triacylglycerol synthase family O-acyltransferase, partial [Acidimicrobiales bacterium]|nr:wax ester/triacylglycerol synthase family O-acyltransferase [Acidimicrobiales bacterium]